MQANQKRDKASHTFAWSQNVMFSCGCRHLLYKTVYSCSSEAFACAFGSSSMSLRLQEAP